MVVEIFAGVFGAIAVGATITSIKLAFNNGDAIGDNDELSKANQKLVKENAQAQIDLALTVANRNNLQEAMRLLGEELERERTTRELVEGQRDELIKAAIENKDTRGIAAGINAELQKLRDLSAKSGGNR